MATRILVPLDGSELAEQALSCGAMLARGLAAELVLFRAVSLPTDTKGTLDSADLMADAQLAQLVTKAQEYLSQVANRLLHEAGLGVDAVVRCGPAADAIVDYVEQMHIQQIVMATHGYGGISRWMHGSVAERVLQSASVPILLVRAQEMGKTASYEPMSCRRILVPLDGSPVAEQALSPMTSLAQALDAEVILLQVLSVHTSVTLMGECYLPLEGIIETTCQGTQSYLEQIADSLLAQGIKASTAVQIGGVASAIIEYAETNEIDLIAMCTHGRTGLARWALGSVADRVLRAGSKPLLLVRAKQASE